MIMKTRKTRRSLLWGVLLAGFAGTLTATTHPVRAESTTSSALATALSDGSTVKPFFWTEVGQVAVQAAISVAQGITALVGGHGPVSIDFVSQMCLAGSTGIAAPAYHALPERALD
jgi:hypothetical protein